MTTAPPATVPVPQLIGDLGPAPFATRVAASKELAKFGRPVFVMLKKAEQKTDSAEVPQRLGTILATRCETPVTPEQRQAYRGVVNL